MKYIRSLDGLRAIAILLVMLFHFRFILEIGWIGVQLFFVLSGFLITTILVSEKENSNLSYYLKRFYWRRSLRIFPIYYFYLIVVGIGYLIFQIPDLYGEVFPYLVSYSYNYYPLIKSEVNFDLFFTHFWSLCIEEQFYLFWPFIIYFLSKKHFKILLILIIVFTPVFRLICASILATSIHSNEIGEIVYRLLPSQIDSFAMGAIIPAFSLLEKKAPYARILGVTIAVFIVVGIINYFSIRATTEVDITSLGFPIGSLANYAHAWSYSMIGIVSFMLIVFTCKSSADNTINRILSSAILVNIGKVSYGMYVYHWILIPVFRKSIGVYIPSDLIAFMIYLMITYIISFISFRVLEKPFINLKDRLNRN